MRGFVLYEGPSAIGGGDIVVIATLQTSNVKTGNMVQVWILPKDTDPLHAVQQNANASICGNCPLQGVADANGKLKNRVCYVNLGQAPKAIWSAYNAGKYPRYNRRRDEPRLRRRDIRLGAYGDPAAMPIELVKYLANVGAGWTGYSHQLFWIDRDHAEELAKYCMASCHTPAQHAEARRRGWRSFVAIHPKQDRPKDAVECPNYTHGVQCDACQLCQGTSKHAKDVYVIAHGAVGRNLPVIQRKQGAKL